MLVVAVTMPLWAGYLVKGYAWRALLDPGGGALVEVFGRTPGFGYTSTVIVLSYLWFPYMVIPIYAGLDRLPNSLLEASTDLGAKAGRTFRSVVLPQVYPALVAGSIFTFSLTLGDFYMNRIVGGTTEFIGNVVYRQFSVDLPFAAAYSAVPIVDHGRLPARGAAHRRAGRAVADVPVASSPVGCCVASAPSCSSCSTRRSSTWRG